MRVGKTCKKGSPCCRVRITTEPARPMALTAMLVRRSRRRVRASASTSTHQAGGPPNAGRDRRKPRLMRSSSTVRQVLDCFPPRDRAFVQPSGRNLRLCRGNTVDRTSGHSRAVMIGRGWRVHYRTGRTCRFLVTTSMDIRVIERHAAARGRKD